VQVLHTEEWKQDNSLLQDNSLVLYIYKSSENEPLGRLVPYSLS